MMISIGELQQVIAKDVASFQTSTLLEESSLLQDSIGRILSEDIKASMDIPSQSVSAMDGYGIYIDDEVLANTASFSCVGEAIAGKPFNGHIGAQQCVRIMTGAVIPDGVNTVVMQENTSHTLGGDNSSVTLTQEAKRGSNIRQQGEEVSKHATVLKSGHLICANDIPLLASLGYASVKVYATLNIGVFSTGDELCEVGSPLNVGQIYDSNRPTIKALLKDLPVCINDYGIIKDDLDSIKAALLNASQENHIVVTSGGVSVGDYDFLKTAVSELGDIVQYKVALKPGKPFVYGLVNQARYFGLPGNPLSSMIGATLFLVPAIYQHFNITPERLMLKAELITPIKHKQGRAGLQRGIAKQTQSGLWQVGIDSSQDSHRVHQLSRANVLIYLGENETEPKVGDQVNLLPLHGRFL